MMSVSCEQKASRGTLSIFLLLLLMSTWISIALWDFANTHAVNGAHNRGPLPHIAETLLFAGTNSSTSLTKEAIATRIPDSDHNVTVPRGNFGALLQRHKTYRIYIDG